MALGQSIDVAIRPNERFLGQILGVLAIEHDAIQVTVDGPSVAANDGVECRTLALLNAAHPFRVSGRALAAGDRNGLENGLIRRLGFFHYLPP
jgi:hypothetical protein